MTTPGASGRSADSGSAAGTTSGWLSSAVGLLPRPAVMAGQSGGHRHIIAFDRPAPEGHDHWTLRLLAGKAVELSLVESLSHETVRLRLKKRAQAVAKAAMVHPEGEQ